MANRFDRYGPLILAAATFAVFLVMVFSLELFVSFKQRGWHLFGPKRFILLKEHEPGKYFVMHAPRSYLKRTDGLEDKEFVYRADSNGFIGPFFEGDASDLTIAFQGGSTTECQAMEEKNRFPYLSAKLLERNGARIKPLNAGVSGINTLQSINILVNKLLPLKPDILVYMENINDLVILMYQKSYWGGLRPQVVVDERKPIRELAGGLMKSLFPHLSFELNNYIGSRAPGMDDFAQSRGYRFDADTALLFGDYSKAIETYVGICKANGILPVLMTQQSRLTASPDSFISAYTMPMEKQGFSYGKIRFLHRGFNERIRKIAAARSIPLIDLEAMIPQTNRYVYDMVHLNDSGSTLAAQCIRQQLQPVVDSILGSRKNPRTVSLTHHAAGP